MDKFIDLIERNLFKDYIFWPYTEILGEGHILKDINLISAWKSNIANIRIVIVEDKSYEYESKFIAFYSCPDDKLSNLKMLFDNVDKELDKLTIITKRKIVDEQVIKWIKDHLFILQIFGISGITGGILWLIFNRKISYSQRGILDILIFLLTKIIPILLLLGMIIFLIIIYFRIFRIITQKLRK